MDEKWIHEKETEGLITAAQDQALPTRRRKVNIEKQHGTPLCRMSNEEDETVFDILCECPKMAQTDYKKRHDKVAPASCWSKNEAAYE